MILAGILFYYTIRKIVYNQIDDSLLTEKTIIGDQIEETDKIPDFSASFGHLIEVRLLDTVTTYTQVINDTVLLDPRSNTLLHFRHLSFSNNTSGNTGYIINIYKLLDENQKLLNNISLGMFILFLSHSFYFTFSQLPGFKKNNETFL